MDEADLLDQVFERFLSGNSIFQDREVLRHDYVPDILPHREKQIQCIGQICAPVLRGARCSNLLVYGKTGTGKTAVVKYVLGKLSRRAIEIKAPIEICYMNCRVLSTEYRILSKLCTSLGVAIPFTGLAVGEVFDRFKTALDSRKTLLVVVLDEVDALAEIRGDTLLYELTRINAALNHSKVSVVGISNNLGFKELLDPRVMSSLSEEEVVFRPYDASELRDILLDRARLAFHKCVLFDGALGLCAALAAAEHGDARRALDLLRVAGELSEREGSEAITENHIRRAERRIEHDRINEVLENLPLHSKLTLCSVYFLSRAKVDCIITGNIYELYCRLCDEIGLTPLTQRRVSSLINELDVMGLLNTRIVSMGRYGRTKRIHLSIAHSIVKRAFMKDDRLSGMTCPNMRFSTTFTERNH
ncbi:MAG: ORC1-type DNA replication protein [Candidatus Bathyarchaeota archaeon]|nr:MAG: ORC1-type DNA replication protein [Candidatus Bathyarchaeota archaeon]